MRVFLGTEEVAGYYRGLARGLSEIGIDCMLVELVPYAFGHNMEAKTPIIAKIPRRLSAARNIITGRSGSRVLSRLIGLWDFLYRTVVVFPWAVFRFDVFCLNGNTNIVGSYFGYWDLKLLKYLGRKVIVVFHGSDSRPPYMNGAILNSFKNNSRSWKGMLYESTIDRKLFIKKVESYASTVISNPVYAHFNEKAFVNIMHIGLPTEERDMINENKRKTIEAAIRNKDVEGRAQVHILHAPSRREAKGSDQILRCIEKLKAQGYRINYREMHGVPNSEINRALAECDFVIDQLYSDAPMAGFAAEAASYGKPAIVCGYLGKCVWLDRIPTYYCHPHELEGAIKEFITKKDLREKIGRAAREFIQNEWGCKNVARKYVRVFKGAVPSPWMYRPTDIRYVHGWGIKEEELRAFLRSYIDEYGISALQLDDKPMLKDSFLRLAEGK